jgi:hypothetical protein
MSGDPGARTVLLGGVGNAAEKVDTHVVDHHEALFFTKLSDWEHESEYRFVLLSNTTEPVTCSYGDALRAVIVGHEFPEWQVPSALALCAKTSAMPKRMHWELSQPWVIDLKPKVET